MIQLLARYVTSRSDKSGIDRSGDRRGAFSSFPFFYLARQFPSPTDRRLLTRKLSYEHQASSNSFREIPQGGKQQVSSLLQTRDSFLSHVEGVGHGLLGSVDGVPSSRRDVSRATNSQVRALILACRFGLISASFCSNVFIAAWTPSWMLLPLETQGAFQTSRPLF